MWKLKIAEGGPELVSLNNFIGRQHWEFDPDAGTPEERAELRKENPCGPIPPPVQVKETEVTTEEAGITTLKRAVSFFSSIQAHDGHWPVESAGPLYFLQPMVCIFKPFVSKKHTPSLSLSIPLLKKIKLLSKL
ncbi:lupeol synthase [Quercus suber]|uniref:Lupeol synthase n=1 Tax=Quercus suber TaxID=58331 RepID=A0AAW0KSK9_QUESU